MKSSQAAALALALACGLSVPLFAQLGLAPSVLAQSGSAASGVPPAQLPSNSLHVQVNLVNVPVTVIGPSGTPVRGLRARDFRLTEDGRAQAIRVFQQSASRPVAIVLAIDTSLSVHQRLSLEKQAAHAFVHSLLRPADQLELLAFAGDVTEAVPFTNDLRRIDRGIDRLHGEGPTALYAAVATGAEKLAGRDGRKVIVIVSDGGNSMPGADYEQARAAALRAKASIESIIIVPIAASAGRNLAGEHALIQMSRDTGGQYFYAERTAQMAGAFAQVSRALRAEYLLGYYPATSPREPEFRRIHVVVADPVLDGEYRLHYRAGYYAVPAP